ncbi:phospholipase D family protein [Ramlibacter sp. WS9]|uniref:phospholipase D family protein n=1 Tax=Ramlibacter sp. WS9 TaxID=1882741 RepID=UPI001142BEEE|nr:phospholipase D family protein [Ramlibacter sp. WS9]ROZ76103.1 hypothetical protein EEB15_13145 [Ramlibacter sp. WS9]
MFELVDSDWDKVIEDAALNASGKLRLVCPFIKSRTVARLLERCASGPIEVITRFCLADFYEGVSDIAALELLLNRGAQVRGVKGLHSKLYLFGPSQVVLTSANLTEAALLRNKEFGFHSDDADIAHAAHAYFDRLWKSAGRDLTALQLEEWKLRVVEAQAAARPERSGQSLPDFGTVVAPATGNGLPQTPLPFDSDRAFLKFFGTGTNRADRNMLSLAEVERSGCHWACTYPMGQIPRAVGEGDVMYISRLIRNPNDSLIFGRARALRHDDARDIASASEIARRPWKKDWPRYIRVHHAEFVAGSIGNGVSLSALIEALGSDSFVSTQRNAALGTGNTSPTRALMQKAHVQLTQQAFRWLDARIEACFEAYGTLPADALAKLDWPEPA